jgi:chromosome segregation ATPase
MQHECERLGLARAAADTDVQRLSADLSVAKRVLEDTRREFQATFDRQSTEHAAALAALAASIAERDERQERLQATLAAGRHDIEQIQETLMATVEALEATKSRQEVLQTQADSIPESHDPRHESRANDFRVARRGDVELASAEAAATLRLP